MFYHSFFEDEGEKVLAVCDKKILGEVLEHEEGTFRVSEDFYGGEEIGKEELLDKAGRSSVLNAVGNDVVEFLTKNNFFDKDKVIEVEGVKHAQMLRL